MTYRILVTGSRTWEDQPAVWRALANAVREIPHDREITIIHGACKSGADQIAHEWARGFGATIEAYPAEDFGSWPGCGPRRNQYMVSLGADVCLAFIKPCTRPRCRKPKPHDSHGTAGTVKLCNDAGIPVRPIRLADPAASGQDPAPPMT